MTQHTDKDDDKQDALTVATQSMTFSYVIHTDVQNQKLIYAYTVHTCSTHTYTECTYKQYIHSTYTT